MSGCRVNFASLKTKTMDSKEPATTRHMTFGESQGKVTPPKFSPSSNITMRLSIERLPAQSIALAPSANLVRGLCTSKKISSRRNVVPATGRLIQKIHRQETYCANVPPRIGPIPPAMAHITFNKPKYNARLLSRVTHESSLIENGASYTYLKLNKSDRTIFTSCVRPPPAVP